MTGEQLDPVVLAQDSLLNHLLELRDGEPVEPREREIPG
jgi:hypothetical protein